MEEHRRTYFATVAAILLSYFIAKLYEGIVLWSYPDASPAFWVVSSSIFVLILIVVLYVILYHDKPGFLSCHK